MNTKKVSVIIPVYNSAKTLLRCAESVIYGEYSNIEIILVDDCSTDDSWEICTDLAKRYPQLHCYQNERNRGVSYTRNMGLSKASGELIMFVDSDDWVSRRFIKTMVDAVEQYKDSLPICGLHFCNTIDNAYVDYLWKDKNIARLILGKKHFFDLVSAFLIQQIWNKVFEKSILDGYNIHFDESKNMGEDFQFVLDYLQMSGFQNCVIVNEPLYYYVRANNSSLMSQFGNIENNDDQEKLVKLLKICGENDPEVINQYNQVLMNTKQSYIYWVSRNKKYSKKNKIDYIEQIMSNGKAHDYYKQEQIIQFKEDIIKVLHTSKAVPLRAIHAIQRYENRMLIILNRMLFKKDWISIVSQNCIGGVFYHDMQMQFMSPTINLYFTADDFLTFVENIDYYLSFAPKMEWLETYPIGILDNITIHFMHYDNCTDALNSWERRKTRIDKNKIFVFMTDMEGFNDECFKRWENLPYPKVLFTRNSEYREYSEVLYFNEYCQKESVPDLIPERKFYKITRLTRMIMNK